MDQFQFIIDKGKNTFKEIYENKLTKIERVIEKLLNFVYEKNSTIPSKDKNIKIFINHERQYPKGEEGPCYNLVAFKLISKNDNKEEYRNFINEFIEIENYLYFIGSDLEMSINNKMIQIKSAQNIDMLIFKEKDGEKNEILIQRNHTDDDFEISVVFNIKEKE